MLMEVERQRERERGYYGLLNFYFDMSRIYECGFLFRISFRSLNENSFNGY